MPRPTSSASSLRSANRLRACALACTVAASTLVATPERARATGGGDSDDYTSFFAPEIIGKPEETPFFLTYHAFYPYDEGDGMIPASEIEAINTKEWAAYFRGKVSEAKLAQLIYKMKLGELDQLIWAFEGKRPNLSKDGAAIKAELDALANNPPVLPALYYLGFAKRCEPIATRGTSAIC